MQQSRMQKEVETDDSDARRAKHVDDAEQKALGLFLEAEARRKRAQE